MAEPLALPSTSKLRRDVFLLWTAMAVILTFGLIYVCRAVVFLLFIALVLAIALKPLVAWTERRTRSRTGSVVLVYAVACLLLASLALFAFPVIFNQVDKALDALPQLYYAIHQRMAESENLFLQRVAGELPATPTGGTAGQGENLAALGQYSGYAKQVLHSAFVVFSIGLFSFYWSILEERSLRWLLLWIPAGRREAVRELYAAVENKVGAYVRGQVLVCGVMALMASAAYFLIGLPYALALGALAGLLEIIPIFGPLLGAVPPLALALSVDPHKAIWVVVAATIMQQTENYLLVPRVMDHSVGVHPIVTLLAIAGFGSLLGWMGAVLAIPLAAICQTFLERLLLSPEAMKPVEPAGRDSVSILRYQTQELERDIRLQLRNKMVAATPGNDRLEETIEGIARDLSEGLSDATANHPEGSPAEKNHEANRQ